MSHNHRKASTLAWPLAVGLLVAGVAAVGLDSRGVVRHPALMLILIPLAFLVYVSEQYGLPSWKLDAGHAVTLVTLIVCGPLAALIVAAFPEPFRPLVERRKPPRTIALVADVASFAWQAVAGEMILRLLPHGLGAFELWPVYTIACSVMVLANAGIALGVLLVVHDGRSWSVVVRVVGSMLPLAFLGAVIAALYAVVGVPALLLFAAVACLPGVFVRIATPILSPRVAELDRSEVTQRYARAIAVALGLSRRQRRVVALASASDRRAPGGFRADRLFGDLRLAGGIRFELQLHEQGTTEVAMSLEACIVEVARAWAALTASGTPQLTHTAALRVLEADRTRFSARVLRAAWQVVDEQPRRAKELGWAPTAWPLARRIAAIGASVSG